MMFTLAVGHQIWYPKRLKPPYRPLALCGVVVPRFLTANGGHHVEKDEHKIDFRTCSPWHPLLLITASILANYAFFKVMMRTF